MKTLIKKFLVASATIGFCLTLILLPNLFCKINYVYSQEENECGAVEKRINWFYGQRVYPLDSVPPNAFTNAVSQKEALISSFGYKLSGPNNNWSPIGPMPFEPNSFFGTLASGRIAALTYGKRDLSGNTVYIAGADGGVWKTQDGGVNWTNISGDLPTLVSGAIAIDAQRGIIYYGSGSNTLFDHEYMGMGVFKTTDEQHWTRISNGLPNQTQIFKIAIDPNNPDNIFIAEWTGLYKSTDGGASWFKPLSLTASGVCTDVCFSPSGNKVYAIGTAPDFWEPPFNGIGYWRSTDQGNSFWQIGQGCGFPHSTEHPYGRSCFAVSQASENTLYILSYDNYSDGLWCPIYDNRIYVYKSLDGGLNFTNYSYYVDCYMNNSWNMGANAGYNEMIRCSDVNPDICFMGFQDLFRTTDGNQSWSMVAGYTTSVHPDFHSLDFNPYFPNKIFLGCDGGAFRSDDLGISWSNMNQNLSLTQLYTVSSSTYNSGSIDGGLQDEGIGYKYPNISPTYWKSAAPWAYGCDGGLTLSSPFKSNHFVGGLAACSELDYSYDGSTWNGAANYYDQYISKSSPWIAADVNHPSQPGVLYTVRFGPTNSQGYTTPITILKSTDYGANWNVHDNPISFANPFQYVAPSFIAISQSDPNTMIINDGSAIDFWHYLQGGKSRLLKTTDGGQNWCNPPGPPCPILIGGQQGVPDRFFTHLEFDPVNVNEMYLTLSGYNISGYGNGHVFRSTDGGNNWADISGTPPPLGNGLPDNPTNDIVIHYTSPTTKEIIVAQDIGVWVTDAQNIQWKALASNLPNSPILKLDHNRLSGILNCATFGRGAWQVQLPGPIYVQDQLYITDNVTLPQQIVVAPGGKLMLGHPDVPGNFTISFAQNTGITVQDGGQIIANSGNQITLTSQSGQWNGIEFDGICQGLFTYCTFQNALVPVSMFAQNNYPSQFYYDFENCHFYNGTILVNNTGTQPLYFNSCTFVGSDELLVNTSINLNYCDNALITNCNISNCQIGINFSNSNSIVNNCSFSYNSSTGTGIAVNNSTNPEIKNNTIGGFGVGIYLQNSSPRLFNNTVNSSYINDIALDCVYMSNPRLKPSGGINWDAGYNFLNASTNGGICINIDNSNPNMAQGKNHLSNGATSASYYLNGQLPSPPPLTYNARGNCWDNGEPDPNKFNLNATVIYDPIDCSPFGSILREDNFSPMMGGNNEENLALDPPRPIIIDLGHGHYDTIKVTNGNLNLTSDQLLYSQGVVQELNGNYTGALNTYKQIVANYKDSVTSIRAIIKMLPCTDKIQNDTAKYTSLENYYLGVVQSSGTDTVLRKVSNELAHRVLVRKELYPPAITNYETDIQNTKDSLEILCYQLNIVETYMLMQQGGNMPQFTGKYKELKPQNIRDGFQMIYDLTHHIKLHKKDKLLPTEFKISQNYPNPFNPTTRIDYQLPKAEKVVLKVYNLLGQLVRELVNEQKEAGYYTVIFDGTNYASGVYFYRIEAGKFTNVKKMVLVK